MQIILIPPNYFDDLDSTIHLSCDLPAFDGDATTCSCHPSQMIELPGKREKKKVEGIVAIPINAHLHNSGIRRLGCSSGCKRI